MYHTTVTVTVRTYQLHGFPLNLCYSYWLETLKEELACINGSASNKADSNRTHCMFSLKYIAEGERPFYKNIAYFSKVFLSSEKCKFYGDN